MNTEETRSWRLRESMTFSRVSALMKLVAIKEVKKHTMIPKAEIKRG